MAEPERPDLKKRKQRNLAIALGILAFVVIVYAVTVLRLSGATQ